MPPVVIDIRSADDSRDVVHRAVQALAEGKLVAFPTETVYCLGASALSPTGIARLSQVKQRPADMPFTLAIKSAAEALDYVPNMSRLAQRLARRCWPGPVTLVTDDCHPESLVKQMTPAVRNVVCPTGTVGLRVPAHQTVLDVLRMMAGPIAITSANRHNEPSAVTAQQVLSGLGDDVQLVLDDGHSRFGQPSSVVRANDGDFQILRVGVVSEQTLKRLASFMLLFVCTGNTCRSPMAEALAKKAIADRLGCKIEELHDRGVIVMSAGISASMGGFPAAEAVEVMAQMGLDLREHESQPLTEQLARHADVICVMTRGHRQAILAEWPEAAPRTRLLCADCSDVADPIGGPAELYRRCAMQLKREIDTLVSELEI
jgi:protein-tyrosine phosphatase